MNEESWGLVSVYALPLPTHLHPSLLKLLGSPQPSFVPEAQLSFVRCPGERVFFPLPLC